MLEPSVGCRFLTSPWATAVVQLFLVVPAGRMGVHSPGTPHLRGTLALLHKDFAPLPSPVEDDGNRHQQPCAPEQTKPAVYRRRIRATPEEMAPYRRQQPGSVPG